MRVTLKKPIKAEDGSDLTAVNVKDDPTVADLLAISKELKSDDPVEKNIVSLARLTGLVRKEIERLSITDYNRLCRVLDGKPADPTPEQLKKEAEEAAEGKA